jgi:hypothetical protein
MARVRKDGRIQMDDGRILTPKETGVAFRGKDQKELVALMKADQHTTFKIQGTFDDAMTKLLGGTPKNPVRLVVRKTRKKGKR